MCRNILIFANLSLDDSALGLDTTCEAPTDPDPTSVIFTARICAVLMVLLPSPTHGIFEVYIDETTAWMAM